MKLLFCQIFIEIIIKDQKVVPQKSFCVLSGWGANHHTMMRCQRRYCCCQSGFEQGTMQPEHTAEGPFARRVIRPDKNHTNTRLKFNMDSPGAQQHHMALFNLLHLLGQDSVPCGTHVSGTMTLVTNHHFTTDAVSKQPCFEGFFWERVFQSKQLHLGSQHSRVIPLSACWEWRGGEGTLPCWTSHQPGVIKEKMPGEPLCGPHSANQSTASAWWTFPVRDAPILSRMEKKKITISWLSATEHFIPAMWVRG